MNATASNQPRFIIGLTGNIGTGKSLVRRMLQHLGAFGIDADVLAHAALTSGEPISDAMIERFGKHILGKSGNIDRVKIARIVFNDKKSLLDLEAILHPLVTAAVTNLIQRSHLPIIVIEAIKLLESDLVGLCDCVWVVDAREQIIFERLAAGRGMERGKIIERLSNQSSIEAKLKKAHAVIENNQGIYIAWQSVLNEWEQLRNSNPVFAELLAKTTTAASIFMDTILLPQSVIFSELEELINSANFFTWFNMNGTHSGGPKKAGLQDLVRLALTHFIFSLGAPQANSPIAIWDLGQFDLTLKGYHLANSSNMHKDLQMVLKHIEQFGNIHQVQRINIPLDTLLKESKATFGELGYISVDMEGGKDLRRDKAGYNLYQKNISEGFNLFSG